MKFQRTPLILVLIALLLGGVVYFLEVRGGEKQESAQGGPQAIFQFQESQVQSFTVKTPEQTLSFTRSPAKPAGEKVAADKTPTPQWQMTAPKQTAANDATVSYLLSQLAAGQSDRSLTIPANQKAEFGLDQPPIAIEVKLDNQQSHRLVLGKPNFNNSFIYAQADPPATPGQELTVLLVPTSFEYAAKRPLNEWQAAEPPKPKPSPSPSAPASAN